MSSATIGRKALIIGLDGATWDVVDPLLARGELPTLASVFARSARAPMRSTIPPVTAAAWPTIITGMNPGQHGLFRFESVDHVSYDHSRVFVSSERLEGRTIFDYVGGTGERVLAASVPMTYPAWPINGRMVSGFPTPRPDKFFTQPPEWAAELGQHIYRRVPRLNRDKEKVDTRTPQQFVSDAEQWLRQTGDYYRELLRREQFGLVMVVTSMTDSAQHRYFAMRDNNGPSPDDPIDQVYRYADAMAAKFLEAVGDDWLVVVCSDHGAGPRAENLFFVNTWLQQQGLLRPLQRPRENLAREVLPLLKGATRLPGARRAWRMLSGKTQRTVRELQRQAGRPDWSATRAYYVKFSPCCAGININLRGRQSDGIVEPGAEYEALRRTIMERLLEVRYPPTGEQVVVQVWPREEIYAGPFLKDAPDVIFLFNPRFEPRGGYGPLFGQVKDVLHAWVTGDHRMDGILALSGAGVFRSGAALRSPHVADVAPTLLHAMGLEVPANMEGRVLDEAFEPGFLAEHPIRRGAALDTAGETHAHEYSEEEEEGIAAALRHLGYIE